MRTSILITKNLGGGTVVAMQITQVTRRDIVDAIVVERVNWAGRMEEQQFLARLFNLGSLPSTDHRFSDAASDIWQHRVRNDDWDNDWVFYDRRFDLINADDEVFLRFLCETIHPIVRPDTTEVVRLCQLYNEFLKRDGYQIVEKTKISGKPIFVAQYIGMAPTPAVSAARQTLGTLDPGYIAQQITRMEAAVAGDPDLAIGTAKELVESCCKTILEEKLIQLPRNADLPQLVRLTCKNLSLTPQDIPDKAKAADTIKRLLSNLGTIGQGLAELRNLHGTGHGKAARAKGLTSRHAKLAVGAASTLAVFLTETHLEQRNLKPKES